MPFHPSARRSRRLAKSIFFHGMLPAPFQDHLMRRLVRVPALPPGITFSIARSHGDLDAAFSLVYQAYRQKGITAADPSRRRITLFHALPSTAVLVAKTGDRVVATVTIIRDGALGLPADSLACLSPYRIPGKSIAEISSLALRPDLQGQATGVLFHLTRFMIRFSRDAFGVHRFVIAVHPERLPLYRGIFLFTPLSGPVKSHGFANNAPAVVAVRNLETAETDFKRIYGRRPVPSNLYQFLFGPLSREERMILGLPGRPPAETPLSPDTLDLFFRRKTRLFETASPATMATLARAYPAPEYRQALAQSDLPVSPLNERTSS